MFAPVPTLFSTLSQMTVNLSVKILKCFGLKQLNYFGFEEKDQDQMLWIIFWHGWLWTMSRNFLNICGTGKYYKDYFFVYGTN